MTTIRLAPPRRDGQAVSFSWRVEPETRLYRATEFEFVFPESVEISSVPDAIWWRVALICLHTQWPLLRPCQVVLPVRLPPGEREFWARMCDASVATLEATAGGFDCQRRIDLVESGPVLDEPGPGGGNELAVACFSGGRDSLTQTAMLQELGVQPLLVTVTSPREGSIEHQTSRRGEVMREIVRRRGLELVEVTSTLRACWDNGFAADRYAIAVSELTDTLLYFAAALAVASARGASDIYHASEAEVQESVVIGGQVVQHKHFMYSGATQRSLSAMIARFGIRYGGLTYPLRHFQVQRLLNLRYTDLADLQYSCWSMTADEGACSRCDVCRENAFNLMVDGRAPAEIGIDLVPLLQAQDSWRPRYEEQHARLPNGRWRGDMQTVRCLEAVTPDVARGYIEREGPLSASAIAALEAYARMRDEAIKGGAEPEPGYMHGFVDLIDERLQAGVTRIFDEHFEREGEREDAGNLARCIELSDWICAPLSDPALAWRAGRTQAEPASERPLRVAPPAPAVYRPEEFDAIAALVPDPEPPLAQTANGPLRVATALLDGNELDYVTECVRTSWISSAGSFVPRFEAAFAQAADCRFAVACSSGTTALHLTLAAAGIGPGDEVIVPTFTMIASANAVGYVGATAVLVDSDERTWNLDIELVRDRIGPRTRAILIMHTYGHPVDADAIGQLAAENELAVIEDAAEAHGAEYHGRRAGSLGTVAAFSFYANKIVTTGEGGMVTTSDESIAAVARELRDHAFSAERHFWHRYRAYNFRMSNLQAAVGLAQVERLDDLIERRRLAAERYREALGSIPGVALAPTQDGYRDANWMFGILVDDEFGIGRDELRRRLAQSGIETRTFFVPIHLQPAYHASELGRRYPVAERLGRCGLYLPSGPDVGEPEVARVSDAVRRARG